MSIDFLQLKCRVIVIQRARPVSRCGFYLPLLSAHDVSAEKLALQRWISPAESFLRRVRVLLASKCLWFVLPHLHWRRCPSYRFSLSGRSAMILSSRCPLLMYVGQVRCTLTVHDHQNDLVRRGPGMFLS